MKFIRYALVLALLSSGGLFAAPAQPAKAAKSTKIETKKKTHAYAKKDTAKTAVKDRQSKSTAAHKKMATKEHKTGLHKPVTKTAAVKGVAKDRPAVAATKSEPTWFQKAEKFVGLGTAGAAATKAVSMHKQAGYHTGPRAEKWIHHFGPGAKGFVEGTNEYGHWVFAGYRPDWWKTNYPIYYKDVVFPLYKQTSEYKKSVK